MAKDFTFSAPRESFPMNAEGGLYMLATFKADARPDFERLKKAAAAAAKKAGYNAAGRTSVGAPSRSCLKADEMTLAFWFHSKAR